MTKIGIVRCNAHSENCAGWHCFPTISKKAGQFQQYDAVELVGFDTCGGCGASIVRDKSGKAIMGEKSAKIVFKAQRLKDHGAEVIHIGNCILLFCPIAEQNVKDIKEKVNIPVWLGCHESGFDHNKRIIQAQAF